MDQMTRVVLLFCAIIISFASAHAGSLTPPSGAPGPTFKTLDEAAPGTPLGLSDMPIVITEPGFYYLKENIEVGRAEVIGISIQSSDVTIDLGGFHVRGGAEQETTPLTPGIRIGSGVQNTVIRNGRVLDFTGIGIEALVNASATHVHDIQVSRANRGGIFLRDGSIVERCLVEDIGLENAPQTIRGIQMGSGSIVTHCTVRGVEGRLNGFVIGLSGSASRIDNCVISNIGTRTTDLAPVEAIGITAGGGSVTRVHVSFVGSTSTLGAQRANGIQMFGQSTVADCTISQVNAVSRSHGIDVSIGGPVTIKDTVISGVRTTTVTPAESYQPVTCGIYLNGSGSVTRNIIQGVLPPQSASPTRYGVGIFQTSSTGAVIMDNQVLIDQVFGDSYTIFGIRFDRLNQSVASAPRNSQVIGNRIMATEGAKNQISSSSRAIVVPSTARDVYVAANVANLPITISSSSVDGTVPAPNVVY